MALQDGAYKWALHFMGLANAGRREVCILYGDACDVNHLRVLASCEREYVLLYEYMQYVQFTPYVPSQSIVYRGCVSCR